MKSPSRRTNRTHSRKGSDTEDISLDDESGTLLLGVATPKSLWQEDGRNLILLTLLYCFQGIPLGLCGGSLPFILKKDLSYSAIGVFSLSTLPFSLK
jgi:PAT family acetyl-CoA transporter-like MFS transporter 1